MGKKDDRLSSMAGDLAEKLREDRDRISGYLTKLINSIGADVEQIVVAADAVAKISNALTQQNHLAIDAMKIIAKHGDKKDDPDEIDDEIGRPFDDDVEPTHKGPN